MRACTVDWLQGLAAHLMGYESLADLQEQKRQVRDIVFSTWGACVDADPEHPDKPFKVGRGVGSEVWVVGCVHVSMGEGWGGGWGNAS